MTNYVSDAELKAFLSIGDTVDDSQVAMAASAGTLLVNKLAGRRFDSVAGGTRVFRASSTRWVDIDDAVSVTAVAIGGSDGTYPTVLTPTQYWVEPFNGVGPNRQTGWPVDLLRSVGSFPVAAYATVQVNATAWGWAAVPVDVKQAAMFASSRLFHLRDAPFGTVAGSIDSGPLPVRDMRYISDLLSDYRRPEIA